jgi:hypothetical protein
MKFLILVFLSLCFSLSVRFKEQLGCTILNANKQVKLVSFDKLEFDQKQIEQYAKNLFPSEVKYTFPNSLQLMFPSAIWLAEENAFLVVVRVVVGMQKSFAYTALFDSKWKQIKEKKKIGKITLPSALQIPVADYSLHFAGPEDSRIFRAPDNSIMCIFNMLDADKKRKMFLFSFENGKTQTLQVEEYKKNGGIPSAEKNWTPLVIEGEKSLYFVYNFKNAQVLRCKESKCSLATGEFDSIPGLIKGGTPFYRFHQSDYYFSLTYTHHNYDKSNPLCIVYRPTITIVKAERPFKFSYIYNSEPMEFGHQVFGLASAKGNLCGDSRILTVGSVAWMDLAKDQSVLTVNVNDNEPLLVTISGLERFIARVVYAYEHQFLKFSLSCAESLAVAHFGTKEDEE